MGGYSVLDPTNYLGTPDDEEDDQTRAMRAIVAPTPAAKLVPPSPIATGVSAPPDDGAVRSISGAQPIVRPGLAGKMQQALASYNSSPAAAQYAAAQTSPQMDTANPDPNASLRPGGSNPGAQPGALAALLPGDQPAVPQGTGAAPVNAQQGPGGLMPAAGSQGLQSGGARKHGVWDSIGSVLVPGAMAMFPGTSLGEQRLARIQQERDKNAAGIADVNSQAAERLSKAQGTYPIVATPEMAAKNPDLVVGMSYRPQDLGGALKQSTAGRLRNAGIQQRDVDQAPSKGDMVIDDPDNPGQKKIVVDPNNPVTVSRLALNAYRNSMAKVAALKASIEKEKITPGSPAFQQRQQQINAEGARAQAYMGRYLLAAKGVDLQGNGLPGQTILNADDGTQTGVGTAFQSQAAKQQGQVGQFNDVLGALNNFENAGRAMAVKGEKFNDPAVAAALADPKYTAAQWAQGLVKSNLSPTQRDYVIQKKGFDENLQALRKAGGLSGSTEAQVDRLIAMSPGASTPDLDYFLRATGTIRGTAQRLGKTVTGVRGGQTIHENGASGPPQLHPSAGGPPRNAPAAPPGQVRVWLPNGKGGGTVGHVSPAGLAAFKKDNPTGQVF